MNRARIGIVTVSDRASRGEYEDKGGPAIQAWLDDGSGDTAVLAERVNAIFQACSFQDLTGQRIRRAIKQLQQVETMLEGLMPGAPAAAAPRLEVIGHAPTVADSAIAGPDLAQAEIDRLLNG